MTVGAHIPAIAAISPCMQKFARDALGDLRDPTSSNRFPSAAVVCISDRHRLNCDLVRLLFVQAH